jgi:hypothetical protein
MSPKWPRNVGKGCPKNTGLISPQEGLMNVSMDWFCWENLPEKPSIFPFLIWGFPVNVELLMVKIYGFLLNSSPINIIEWEILPTN